MEHAQAKRIGEILKTRRNQLGYTQELAAEKTGISYSYYTKIERGQQLPSLEICLQIAKTFHLSLDYWLLGTLEISFSPEIKELLNFLDELNNDSMNDIRQFLQKISLFIH